MPDDPILSLPWPQARPLDDGFFQRDAQCVARELLGKVIRHRVNGLWLAARIIETEAYLGVNDIYPFNRAELRESEPAFFALMQAVWDR